MCYAQVLTDLGVLGSMGLTQLTPSILLQAQPGIWIAVFDYSQTYWLQTL